MNNKIQKILLIRQSGGGYHVFSQGKYTALLIDSIPAGLPKQSLFQGIYVLINEHENPLEKGSPETKIIFNSLRKNLLRKLTSPEIIKKLPRSKLKVLTIRTLSLLTKLSKLLEILDKIED